MPSPATEKADTVPAPVPAVGVGHEQLARVGWAGTRSRTGPGPAPRTANPRPDASVQRRSTTKLSIWDVPTRVPAKLVPVELNNTSPGCAPSGSVNVECDLTAASGRRETSTNPV